MRTNPFKITDHRLIVYSIFLAGDAAHTHSPMGGQGMNVSIQDTYNLVWKLGTVITEGADPIILETYDTERRPVAMDLMRLDSQLVKAYEQEESSSAPSGINDIRERYAGFMAGVEVAYSHNVLIAEEDICGSSCLAGNIKLGMRLPSFPVVYQCDGTSTHLGQRLISDASWKLLIFSGDLRQPARMNALSSFADTFSKHSLRPHSTIEPLLIQSNPRTAVNLLGLPEIVHPFDDALGWDYWKVFVDDMSAQAYRGYGIDPGGQGCLVLCRPDQHVAWIGGMQDVAGLCNYFSGFFSSPRKSDLALVS